MHLTDHWSVSISLSSCYHRYFCPVRIIIPLLISIPASSNAFERWIFWIWTTCKFIVSRQHSAQVLVGCRGNSLRNSTQFLILTSSWQIRRERKVCLFGFLTSSSTTRLYRGRAPRQERLTILRAATHETELGDHDFCLSRSHYTDTDPTCRERAATAGIEPGTSSPGVARSTAELPRPRKDLTEAT